MEMQNITLSVPKEILYKAKRVALEKHTSLSGLLTQALTEIVESSETYDVAGAAKLPSLNTASISAPVAPLTWATNDAGQSDGPQRKTPFALRIHTC